MYIQPRRETYGTVQMRVESVEADATSWAVVDGNSLIIEEFGTRAEAELFLGQSNEGGKR